ncbi:hypothetical protein N9F62_00165 [bacterium]|nr:hypothetical protein [bacterium]
MQTYPPYNTLYGLLLSLYLGQPFMRAQLGEGQFVTKMTVRAHFDLLLPCFVRSDRELDVRMSNRNTLPRFLMCLSLLPAFWLFTGCSAEQEDAVRQRRDNLSKLGQAYLDMSKSVGHSPKTSDTLAAWMAESEDSATRGKARDCLVEGDVIVNWDGDLSDADNLGRYVLAFEAATPARGGYVVLGDAVVKSMNVKDFQAAAMLPQNQE